VQVNCVSLIGVTTSANRSTNGGAENVTETRERPVVKPVPLNVNMVGMTLLEVIEVIAGRLMQSALLV
jgi:hypothetical protein